MTRGRLALVTGVVCAGLVVACSAVAWRRGSPLVPRHGGLGNGGTAWGFLALLVAAFVLYLVALLLLRRVTARLAPVLAIAVVVQLAPLGAPLLLSTDAWTYWDYGRIAAVHDGNPYVDPPSTFPGDPAFSAMGARWRERTSVYGPGFTLASEPLALLAGESSDRAAWVYKTLAGLAALAATALAAFATRRRAAAAAFVGWNPLLAIHLAGGAHNDAWVGVLVLAAVALATARRAQLAGVAWAAAVAVKWVPLVFLALHVTAARARRAPVGAVSGLMGAAVVAGLAGWRYGWHWLAALGPLADNARLETHYALPQRLQSAGVPHTVTLALAVAMFAAAFVWLARQAARGRPRQALAACVLLVTTPYLAVWYLGWAVPLAAVDEDDRLARFGVLALCAYLLPQTIPH